MNKVWFFIANPIDDASWRDTTDWEKHDGYISWGIPDGNRDIKNLQEVGIDDIILCYHAYDKEIVGCCRCKREHYVSDDEENIGYSHRIGISDINFRNPIGWDRLNEEDFKFIDDYLHNPIAWGRSVVPIPKDDWERFRQIWVEYNNC